MLAGADHLGEGGHVLERLSAKGEVLPAPFAPLAHQARIAEDFEVVRHSRLRSVEDLLEFGDAAFPLRQELEDRGPGGHRDGMEPLVDVGHFDRQRMRPDRPAGLDPWHFCGDPKQSAAVHDPSLHRHINNHGYEPSGGVSPPAGKLTGPKNRSFSKADAEVERTPREATSLAEWWDRSLARGVVPLTFRVLRFLAACAVC